MSNDAEKLMTGEKPAGLDSPHGFREMLSSLKMDYLFDARGDPPNPPDFRSGMMKLWGSLIYRMSEFWMGLRVKLALVIAPWLGGEDEE